VHFQRTSEGRVNGADTHLKTGRMVEEAEDRPVAGDGVHLHISRPPRANAFLGGEGAMNLSAKNDADAMDEVGGHDL
jgi:hypothetical protein